VRVALGVAVVLLFVGHAAKLYSIPFVLDLEGIAYDARLCLTMPVGEDFGPVNDVAPEKPLTHELMLLPSREGMFMVTATVDTLSDEGNVVRIFSIPVVVGPAQPASAPVPK